MNRNILLTSLDALENERPLRYYSVQNEFGCDYCEALQSMEASSKYILSRFPIDEILVIGEAGPSDDAGVGKPIRLRDAGSLYDKDPEDLSAFDLYHYRIAQYIDEMSLEQQAYEKLLSEEHRAKLTAFVADFLAQHSAMEPRRLNRFFDELACSRDLYEQLKDALLEAVPEARRDSRLAMKWIDNYLYMQLKPSAKLEILPVNENICARYTPADKLEDRDYWYNSLLDVDQDVLDGKDVINLYVSLGNDSVVDSHVLLNVLNILISTPGSNVRLKKVFKVAEPAGNLTGMIRDNTSASHTTDLVAAAHAFLNYSKTDMLVDVWENCGEHNERISSLIYAARHVDTGISMCNLKEVEQGIRLLCEQFSDERSWTEVGGYGVLFGVLAGCIQADYAPLLAEDGTMPFIELIKWAYRHHLYQQVLTLIESHAPTHMVNSGIFYYCDDKAQAESVIRLLALQRLELKPYEYYKMDDIGHYFVKNYDRGNVRIGKNENRSLAYAALRARSMENQDPEKITGHTACSNIETVQNVLYAYYHLGEVRNKISHADFNAMSEQRLIVSENDVSYAMVTMQETIEFFIMSYEKALEEIGDARPKIVFVTADDVRKAADHISRERFQEERRPKNQ